jgi:hypothetical protein
MTTHRANPWCCRAVEAAAHVLPPENRERYALEFIAELYDMPLSQQIRHSAQLLAHAWALRTALAQSGHPHKEQTMTLTTGRPLACRLGRHRWHWVSNEDTRSNAAWPADRRRPFRFGTPPTPAPWAAARSRERLVPQTY